MEEKQDLYKVEMIKWSSRGRWERLFIIGEFVGTYTMWIQDQSTKEKQRRLGSLEYSRCLLGDKAECHRRLERRSVKIGFFKSAKKDWRQKRCF